MSKQKDDAIYRKGWDDGFANGATAARFQLEADNAKLRELVQKMMRFFEDGDWCTICELVKECEAQEQYDEDCLMRGIFHDRMRELGVEV